MKVDGWIERAARDLPQGWIIQVSVERGSAWVSLYGPDGISRPLPDSADKTLAEQVRDAVRFPQEPRS